MRIYFPTFQVFEEYKHISTYLSNFVAPAAEYGLYILNYDIKKRPKKCNFIIQVHSRRHLQRGSTIYPTHSASCFAIKSATKSAGVRGKTNFVIQIFELSLSVRRIYASGVIWHGAPHTVPLRRGKWFIVRTCWNAGCIVNVDNLQASALQDKICLRSTIVIK